MNKLIDVLRAIYDLVFGWQTLVSALIALLAAIATIAVMRQQIRQERERHDEAVRRKGMAARAQMPDALSEMGRYIRGCAARLVETADTMPNEPGVALATLKGVIEFIENSAAERTFELVSWFQVFRARMAAGIPAPRSAEFADRMYDAALLQAYVNSLYEYARNEATTVDVSAPTRPEMMDALKNAFDLKHMIQNEELYVDVEAKIGLRHA